MKIWNLVLYSVCTFLFISCSNGKNTIVVEENIQTVKQIILEKEKKENWTRELEGERLSEPLKYDYISNSVLTSEDNFKATYERQQPVYPELLGFTSLDTTLLNNKTTDILNDFCKQFSKDYSKKISNLFNEKFIFNSVFFMDSLEKNWFEKYNEEFPVAEKDKSLKLFDDYLIGKPEFSENSTFLEVPVMFFTKNKKLYVKILINPEEDKMIYQVNLNKWEKEND